jgi:hypothetical protein
MYSLTIFALWTDEPSTTRKIEVLTSWSRASFLGHVPSIAQNCPKVQEITFSLVSVPPQFVTG